MNIKIKFNSGRIITLLFLLCDTRFFYLLHLFKGFGGVASNKALLGIYCIFLFAIGLVFKRHLLHSVFTIDLIVFVAIATLSTAIAHYKIGFTLSDSIFYMYTYFVLLSYFPLSKVLLKRTNDELFLQDALLVWDVTCILFIAQYILFKNNGTVFLQLDSMIGARYLYNRSLGLRVYGVFDGFIKIFLPLLAHKCIIQNFKSCKIYLFSIFVMLTSVILIDQSRFYVIVILITIMIDFILANHRRIRLTNLVLGSVLFIGALFILYGKISSVFMSIQNNTGSLYARTGAIEYYISIYQSHKFLGIGVVNPSPASPFYSFVHGSTGIYYTDDVGIIGFLVRFGLVGIIWLLCFLVHIIKIVIKTRGTDKYLSISLVTMFIICMFAQSYFDPGRIVALLFLCLTLEINYMRNEKIRCESNQKKQISKI